MIPTNHTRAHFPLSIAKGHAFCNRTKELAKLEQWIQQRRPILLISPRRHGKTSLALQAITNTGLPYAHLDFFSVIDKTDIERIILKGVAHLISQIGSTTQKALRLASKIFEGTNVKVALSTFGIEVDIQRNQQKPAFRILEILERVEVLAEQAKTPLVLFFDEFQCIGQITESNAIEAVLRQVAQLTDAIAFVFSGSNRHLLQQLFEDRNKPFYKLCEKISLERIDANAYIKHIQIAAQQTWKKPLTTPALDRIFLCTDRHPYYLNLLCSRLLDETTLPDEKTVDAIWQQYIQEERSNVASELELFSKNQKKLLTVIAREGSIEAPLGNAFVNLANMSKTTIAQALRFLEQRDYIYKDSAGTIRVLDPLIYAVLQST